MGEQNAQSDTYVGSPDGFPGGTLAGLGSRHIVGGPTTVAPCAWPDPGFEGQPADAVRVDVVALRDRGDVQVPQVVATAITNEDGRWVAERPARAVKVDQMEIRTIVDGRHLVYNKIRLKQRATVRWGGWFSIIGVELDNTQTQTEHTALVIKPDSAQTPRYCGSGQYLRTSAFVRERP